MNPLIPKYEYLTSRNNDQRIYVSLPDGRKTAKARLVMMNFLHTNHLPKVFHVHHIDGNKLNDNLENLELLNKRSHPSIHSNPLGIPYAERRARNIKKYNNKPEVKNRKALWRIQNKEHVANCARQHYIKNRDKICAYRRERYQKQKQQTQVEL